MGITAAGLTAAAAVVGAVSSTATSIAGSVQQSKAIKDQDKREEEERQKAQRLFDKQNRARNGFAGTILSSQGLGGQAAASTGASSLLGG